MDYKFTQEDIDYLKSKGLTPDDIELLPPDEMSIGGAISRTLKGRAGGIIGGGGGSLGGMVIGAKLGAKLGALGGPAASITIPAGALLGAVVGGLSGSYVGQKGQEAILSDNTNQRLQQEAALASEQHPIVSGATDIAASALASGGMLSPKTLLQAGKGLVARKALGTADEQALRLLGREAVSPAGNKIVSENLANRAALMNVGVQSALNPAIDIGISLATGNDIPSGRQLLMDAVGGAMFSRPSPLGRKFGGMKETSPEAYNYEFNRDGLNEIKEPSVLDYPEQNRLSDRKPIGLLEWPGPRDENGSIIPEYQMEQSGKQIIQPVPESGDIKNTLNEQSAEHKSQQYSPEDLAEYKRLSEKIIASDEMDTPEFQQMWRDFEKIRNKYGGMPPKNNDVRATINSIDKSARENTTVLPELNVFNEPIVKSPLGMEEHLMEGSKQRGKATTETVLSRISSDKNNPANELASELIKISDKKSLTTPWGMAPKYQNSGYFPKQDVVGINPIHATETPILIEEAAHSILSHKLGEFSGKRGHTLYKSITDYLQKGDNDALKEYLNCYLKVVDNMGWTDFLFKSDGLGGQPDKAGIIGTSKGVPRIVGYALGDLDEFGAHLFRTKQFQVLLNEMPSGINGIKTMWQRLVNAVSKLFGIDIKHNSMLDRSLRAAADIMAQERPSDNYIDSLSFNESVKKQTPSSDETINFPERKDIWTRLKELPSSVGRIATFERLRPVSSELADAFTNWETRVRELKAPFTTAIVDLGKYNILEVNNVRAMLRSSYREGTNLPNLTQEQQEIAQLITKPYQQIRDTQIQSGLTINSRTAGKNPYYVEDSMNDKAIDLFTKHPTTPEAEQAKHVWAKYIVKESGRLRDTPIAYEVALKDINDYVTAMGASHDNYLSVNYGALRRAAGFGLPEGLRETDTIRSLMKYGRRASTDLAMFMELESKPTISGSLKLKDPRTGAIPQDGNPNLANTEEAKNAMKWVTGNFGGTMSVSMPKVNAIVRLVNNALLGPATGLRDTASIPLNSLPYIKSFDDLSAAVKGIMNLREYSRKALESGAKQPSIDKIQFNELNESTDRFSNTLSKVATGLRKWQGREMLENLNRDITFGMGYELVKVNIEAAKKGSKSAKEFLTKFGTLVEGDVTQLEGEALTKALTTMAANFTERNQGTYGGRGLPSGVIDSQFAPFLALQKWSIEKTGVIFNDVIKPAYKGENYLPLITYTLGSVLTGTAIQELNELLTNRKAQDPTWKEALVKGDTKAIVSELATLMQLGSYAGVVGDILKFSSDTILHGKAPRNIISFPTATAAIDMQEKIMDVAEALRQGEDTFEVLKKFSLDTMSHNIQAARMIVNQTVKDKDLERSDKFRDIRVFNELEGEPNKDFMKSNPYLGLETKEFKQATTPEEVIKQLPEVLKGIIAKANGDPYKLKQLLAGLKANSYQTMPSPENMPVKFLKYLNYLRQSQGDEAAAERLKDYLTQNSLNKMKSSVVP